MRLNLRWGLRSVADARLAVAAATAVYAGGTGVALSIAPIVGVALAALPAACLITLWLTESAFARAAWIVVGGLLTLQSGAELSVAKLGYLAGAALCITVACSRASSLRGTVAYGALRPVLWATACLTGVILISLPVALSQGVTPTAWLRDVAPYALVAAAPAVALDLHLARGEGFAKRVLVVSGALALLSFVVEWVSRRDLLDLALDRVVLPSFLLAAALFACCVGMVLLSDVRRWRWGIGAAVVFALLLVTGNRSSLVVLAIPVAMLLSQSRVSLSVRWSRLVTVLGMSAVVVALLVATFSALNTSYESQFIGRATALNRLARDPFADRSYKDRAAQTHAASKAFAREPYLGIGPGYRFTWITDGVYRESASVDSPLSLPAKFGPLGVLAGIFLLLSVVAVGRRLTKHHGATVPRLALVGFAVAAGILMFVGSPFEDKGFAFALMLLLTASLPFGGRTDTVGVK